MKKSIFFICFLVITCCKAQLPPGEYTTINKKAISSFENALKLFQAGNDEKAKEELLKAIEKAPEFIEPHLLLAELYQTKKQTQQAIEEYQKAISINPGFNLNNFYNIAMLEVGIGKYADAKSDFERFLKKPRMNPDAQENAERQLANCNFAIE